MPNTHSTLTGLFTDIADAIREKDGTSTRKVADAFPAAIRAIPSGGDTSAEDGIVERTISAYTNARVSNIASYMFLNALYLTAVSFPACKTIGSNAFSACNRLVTVSFPACTTIHGGAFCQCGALTTVSFPVCTLIEGYAFSFCQNIREASFPACTIIGVYAFSTCNKLATVSFPACTTISGGAFVGCKSLVTVSFPACGTIQYNVFNGCNNLLSLYLYASSVCKLSNSNAFSSTPIAGYTASTGGVYGSIFVPMSLLSAYKSATNWTYYADRFVGVEPEDM